MQKLGLYFCADKGPTMGGNKEARIKSKDYAVQFFKNIYLTINQIKVNILYVIRNKEII